MRLELQADCFAGVWAHSAYEENQLEEGDLEEGLAAAAAVGDDRIQERATGRTDPDSFTHGVLRAAARVVPPRVRRGHGRGLRHVLLMPRLVALLRGVNLAGRRRVAMADLRALLEDLGYEDVRTHLQSGNAVLTTGDSAAKVAADIERAIAERMGLDVVVTVRTAAEMARIVKDDRLGDVADDPARRMVIFLPAKPSREAVKAIRAMDFGDERAEVAGAEVYAWCPGGIGRSALMAALGDQKLTPGGTARNWRTVTRLAEMAAEP